MPPQTGLKKSNRERVRETLLERIGSGRLAQGERIVEARLAEELQVSTIPVREAIRELVAIGVLEFAAHRGAWVRKVSIRETIEALEVRAALESLAIRAGLTRLQARADTLQRTARAIVAAAKKRDFVLFQRKNQEFHRAIFQAAGNAILLRVWDSLAFEVRTRVILEYQTAVGPVALAEEHLAIVEALAKGDGRLAAKLLEAHSRGLIRYVQQRLAAEA